MRPFGRVLLTNLSAFDIILTKRRGRLALKIYFGSFAYFMYLFIVAAFIALYGLIFRKRSKRAKTIALYVLIAINLFQHFFKWIVWPHNYGDGFNYTNTAYNVCAFLIIISPVVWASKSAVWKDFLFYFGTCGASLAMVVPHWFEDQSAFQWEVYRFYFCHALLVATSVLPVLWKLHAVSYKNSWKVGFVFFLALILIVFNDVVCIVLGLCGGGTENMFETLYRNNPCWVMHPDPPAGFEWATNALEALSPNIFLGNGEKPYTPLLWYAIPMYLLITVLATALGCLIDRKALKEDFTNKKKKCDK